MVKNIRLSILVEVQAVRFDKKSMYSDWNELARSNTGRSRSSLPPKMPASSPYTPSHRHSPNCRQFCLHTSISFTSFQIHHQDQSPDQKEIEVDRDIEMQCCEARHEIQMFKRTAPTPRDFYASAATAPS
jgi:hypothetical protein